MTRPCRSRDTARTGSRLGAVRTGGRVAAGRGKKPVAAMVDVEDGDMTRGWTTRRDRGDVERRRIRHLRVFSRLKRRPVSSSRGRPPPSGASCGNPRAQTHPVLRLQVGAERRRHDLAAGRRRRGEVRLARLAPAAANRGGVLHLGVSVRGNTTCLALERGRASAERASFTPFRPERERSGPISKIVTWNYFTAES